MSMLSVTGTLINTVVAELDTECEGTAVWHLAEFADLAMVDAPQMLQCFQHRLVVPRHARARSHLASQQLDDGELQLLT